MHGIVLEIKNGRCVVLKKDGTFAEIRNRNYTVGQEVSFSKPTVRKYLSMAACLILLCTAAFGYHAYFTPTSYIYLDINPSVRLDLNRFQRVIDVVPLNADAQTLLSDVSIRKGDAAECMQAIVSACQEEHYLNETNTDIEVSVRTDNEKLENTVETTSTSIREENLTVSVYQMDQAENDSAMERHISAKRLRVVQAYTQQFGGSLDENLKHLQDLTNDEIYRSIWDARHAAQQKDAAATQNSASNDHHAQAASSAQTSTPTESSTAQKSPAATQNTPSSDTSAPSEHTASVKNTTPKTDPTAEKTLSYSQNHTPKQNSASPPAAAGHQLPAKRLKAIQAYTEQFGGTLEENVKALQGVSSPEIYKRIEAAQTAPAASDPSE